MRLLLVLEIRVDEEVATAGVILISLNTLM
jgi:hypothetical protein